MNDFNKSKRNLMWWAFVIFLVTIPLFYFFDWKHLNESDLTTIDNLVLSEDAHYDPGGGKSSPPSISFRFESTERVFQLTYEEYQCITNDSILSNFKKGDTVAIKIKKADESKFFRRNWFANYSKIYGLSKQGKSYFSLACRNKVDFKRSNAAIIASISSAVLSLFFALVILKPKTKYQALGQLPVDPVFIVLLVWLILCLALR
ncbi:MAG TPA: hypothetical protein VFZ33_13970 [Chitinophagaceae bacterium]